MVGVIDMKTIEERALDYTNKLGLNPDMDYFDFCQQDYIAGATEQRKIDIMRVKQFLEREVAYNGSMICIDNLLIEELCKAIEE